MDFEKIASKIKEIQAEFCDFKNSINKKIEFNEEKISSVLRHNMEVKSLEDEGANDFINFIRTGEIKNENLIELKSRNSAMESGFPVSKNANQLIAINLANLSIMRNLSKVQKISSKSFDVILEENGGKATWGIPSSKEPFVKKFIKVSELVAEPKATSKLIEDIKIDIEKFMSEKIAESFAIAENEAFLHGNGAEMPRGILTLENGNGAEFISRNRGALTTENLAKLIDELDPFYGYNTAFLINKETEKLIKELKDINGRHIWQGKLVAGENNTIFGIPVFINNFMPKAKDGMPAIVYGNFEKGYTIVEKEGNYMMRDPYTERPFIKFYTAKKIGGDVVDGNAFKILEVE